MFENLLHQDRVKSQLITSLQTDTLAPTLLFTGPEGSGKTTAALELARVLSCNREGGWNCACPSCTRHRTLSHPDLLLFGPRTFPQEIRVGAELMQREMSPASYYFFVRAVRKLLKRFDPPLWAGEETRLARVSSSIEAIEEDLGRLESLMGYSQGMQFTLQTAGPDRKELATLLERITEACWALEPSVPDGFPVFMVRAMTSWALLAPLSARKTIILQNADTANDSARNAMLKILEEPPPSVEFVLTASHKATIMATILSRARLYSFEPRGQDATGAVLTRVFKEQEAHAHYPDLRSYFLGKSAFTPEQAEREAIRFLGALLRTRLDRNGRIAQQVPVGKVADLLRQSEEDSLSPLQVLRELVATTGGFGARSAQYADSFPQFLRALTRECVALASDPVQPAEMLMLANSLAARVREAARHYHQLNRSPELLMETLAGSFGLEES